jgi:poly(beta-D-mannuronate) lyase
MRPLPISVLFALAAAPILVFLSPIPAEAYLLPEQRDELKLEYTVTNPNESYFDVAGRMALLRNTGDPILVQLRAKQRFGLSCQRLKQLPILEGELTLPSYYENPAEWGLTAEPLLTFEESMTDLAGAWVASGDRYFADCLVDVLENFAKTNALAEFRFSPERPQAWYALESMIFSAALAFSTVTGEVDITLERRKTIEAWLVRIAKHHFNKHVSWPSCCNNHYYRRSLYMTIVGVIANDDELFQTGLKAVYSALTDINEQGAFNLAVRRGWRAIHYQNYSLLYLVTIMQVAHRQGYDLFNLKIDGRGFQEAVAFLMRGLENPYLVEGLPPGEQDLSFTNDSQYFSWMEIWLTHFENPLMARFIRYHRPISNRGAGGHMTLFMKAPEDPGAALQRTLADVETVRMTESKRSGREPVLKRWKRQQ